MAGVNRIVLSDVADTEICMPAAGGASANALSMRISVGTMSNPLVAGVDQIVHSNVADTEICVPAAADASASVGADASSIRILVGTGGII